jgi:hypothetical protein
VELSRRRSCHLENTFARGSRWVPSRCDLIEVAKEFVCMLVVRRDVWKGMRNGKRPLVLVMPLP